MHLLHAPEPYSPAFGEILYAVSLTDDEKGKEISIFNSAVTQKIGIKKATHAPRFTLNVSDYVRSQINITPFPRQECGLIDARERTFYSCIAHQNWASTNPHTAGIAAVELNEAMCGDAIRYLGEGEQDEICWIAGKGPASARAVFRLPENESLEIPLGRTEIGEPKMMALIINSAHLDNLLRQRGHKWDEFGGFSIEIYASFQLMYRQEYRIRPHNCNKTRMAWWNRYGAVDFYSFESVIHIESKIEKETIRTAEHLRNFGCCSRMEYRVATACSTRKQHEWLAQIMGAPQVWIEKNKGFEPVRLLDTSIPLLDPEKTIFEIRFAESTFLPFQSL